MLLWDLGGWHKEICNASLTMLTNKWLSRKKRYATLAPSWSLCYQDLHYLRLLNHYWFMLTDGMKTEGYMFCFSSQQNSNRVAALFIALLDCVYCLVVCSPEAWPTHNDCNGALLIVIVLCWSQLKYLQILNLTWHRTNFAGLAKLFSDTLLRSTISVLVSCFYDCHFNSRLAWLSQHNSSSNSIRDGLCFCASWSADRHQGMYWSYLRNSITLAFWNTTIALNQSSQGMQSISCGSHWALTPPFSS